MAVELGCCLLVVLGLLVDGFMSFVNLLGAVEFISLRLENATFLTSLVTIMITFSIEVCIVALEVL